MIKNTDRYHRVIDYLRVSVTDRCNLRCVYCMPADGIETCAHEAILRFEEIARLVAIGADLGITKVRLTGGEPLVRRGFVDLVRMIAQVPGIREISMTTNGVLLARDARDLAEAGLHRVNISLDTLDPDRFRNITRWGDLADVLRGIAAAEAAGLTPIKINCVPIHGLNESDVVDLASRSRTDGWHVRFIEVMPLGEGACWSGEGYVPSTETRALIEAALGPLERASLEGNGPARYWRLSGASGTLGFISPVSEHFCQTCNRLRLTSSGQLMPCLMSDLKIDLATPLRSGAGDDELREAFLRGMAIKPERHHLEESMVPSDRLMSRVGG